MFKIIATLFLVGLLLFLSGCMTKSMIASQKESQMWTRNNKADAAFSAALDQVVAKADAAVKKMISAPGYVRPVSPQGFIIRRSAGKIVIIPLDGSQPVMTVYTPDN